MTTVCVWGEMNLTGHASVVIENGYLSFHPENPELLNDLEENIPEILSTANPFVSDFSLPEQPSDLERASAFLKSLSPKSKSLLYDATVGTPPILSSWDWDQKKSGGLVETIDINWLDTGKMQSKLRQFEEEIKAGKRKYQLFTSNCSTLSAELLLVGAGVDGFNAYKSMKQLWDEIGSVNRPHFLNRDHRRILECVREAMEDMMLMRAYRGSLTPLSKVITGLLLASDLITRGFCWTPGDVKVLADELARYKH